jgi:hypothetical protein
MITIDIAVTTAIITIFLGFLGLVWKLSKLAIDVNNRVMENRHEIKLIKWRLGNAENYLDKNTEFHKRSIPEE